jgi:fumarate reductase (CoM/CoB) subunit A
MMGGALHGFREIETDVLVIGGGLAALRAALTARTAGARVVIAVKRRLGKSGSSANTSGGYAAAWSELDELDDPELHYEDTIVGGGWVNDRSLVRALVDEAPARLRELWDMGAEFRRRAGRYHLSPSGDHRRPRVLVPLHMIGTDMTLPLSEAVRAAGADVLENCVIADLLRDGDRIVGAVGIARDKAEGYVIRARATVLGAGGAGRMFPVTSNPIDVRGGGYAVALRAGTRLRDMEFIQFYPWRLIRPFKSTRVPIQPSTFVAGGRLYNSKGERFMESYDPVKKEAATRDVSARGIFDQIRNGLAVDGGVVLDVSQIPDEQFRIDNTKVVDVLDPKGIDYRTIPLIVAPEAHFFMGGVLIDEHGRSDLSGLYAAGENAGGIHGGNRLNSNAVPDTQVFGYRAGLDAARFASTALLNSADPRPIEYWAGRLKAVSSPASTVAPAFDDLIEYQQNTMSLGLGIVRTGDGLRQALSEIGTIRNRLRQLTVATLGELLASLEIEDLCVVGSACAESALLREESRAAHYREDFPSADPTWVRTITIDTKGVATKPIARGDEEAHWRTAPGAVANPKASQPGAKEFVE